MSAVVSETPRTLDVSELPDHAFGPRSTLWWGAVLLICIETTALAILFTTYFYVRETFLQWPPAEPLNPVPGLVDMAVLVASCVPMALCRRAALAHDFHATRRWLVVATIVTLVFAATRAWTIAALPFDWTANAYASVVWTSIGTHTVEGIAGVLENLLLCALFFIGPFERKHFEDTAVGIVFWFFVVAVWLPFALVFNLDGAIR